MTPNRMLFQIMTLSLCALAAQAALAQPPPEPAQPAHRSAPIVTTLKPGAFRLTLLDQSSGEPLEGVPIELEPPGPRARRLRTTTDAAGQATITVAHGAQYQHLVYIDGHAVGVISFHHRAEWADCTILWPRDYDQLPRGRPDLVPSTASGSLVLTATKTPVAAAPPPAPAEVAAEVAADDTPSDLDGFLRTGRIREGLRHYATPESNAERFARGLLEALDGLQQLSAGMNRFRYRRDLDAFRQSVPFLRVTLVGAARPILTEPATPEAIAAHFVALRDALRRAGATLSAIDGEEFKVEVNLTQIRLDLNGDGVVEDGERLVTALGPVFGMPDIGPGGEDIVVRFDSADAKWLEGYTHLLNGLLEIVLAYDWRPVWDHAAHLLLADCRPTPPIAQVARPFSGTSEFDFWADLIAGLHVMQLELRDADGPRRALEAFQAMVACSRESWRRILAETDDDLEWIPSPSQTGPAGARITEEQVSGWLQILDELDAVLAGERLLPHWRLPPGRGIDLSALADSPPRLDPVLLIQGSALVPYVRTGEVSDGARWEDLIDPFGRGFWQFAVWVN